MDNNCFAFYLKINNHLHRSPVLSGTDNRCQISVDVASSINIRNIGSKCASCVDALKPMHLAASLESRFPFPISEHWSKVKTRALALCFQWLHTFLLLALSMGACRLRPSFTCCLQRSMTRMQNLSLLQYSCSTGGADPFSAPPIGIRVNGYKQVLKNYLTCSSKAQSFRSIDNKACQFSDKC